jgi:hypothetical protein
VPKRIASNTSVPGASASRQHEMHDSLALLLHPGRLDATARLLQLARSRTEKEEKEKKKKKEGEAGGDLK